MLLTELMFDQDEVDGATCETSSSISSTDDEDTMLVAHLCRGSGGRGEHEASTNKEPANNESSVCLRYKQPPKRHLSMAVFTYKKDRPTTQPSSASVSYHASREGEVESGRTRMEATRTTRIDESQRRRRKNDNTASSSASASRTVRSRRSKATAVVPPYDQRAKHQLSENQQATIHPRGSKPTATTTAGHDNKLTPTPQQQRRLHQQRRVADTENIVNGLADQMSIMLTSEYGSKKAEHISTVMMDDLSVDGIFSVMETEHEARHMIVYTDNDLDSPRAQEERERGGTEHNESLLPTASSVA